MKTLHHISCGLEDAVCWKQTDSTGVVEALNAHGGDGAIKLCGLFGHTSRLPVNITVLELDPGVSEGNHSRYAITLKL